MKIYIAAPFFSTEQLEFVKKIENALHDAEILYYSPREGGDIQAMNKNEAKKSKRRIYCENIDNIVKCNKVVAVIDGRDTGTIFEMGYATACGIPVVSISNQNYGINIMLAESVQAHVKNVDDMTKALFDSSYTGEEITKVY